jgi:hypothetical protein
MGVQIIALNKHEMLQMLLSLFRGFWRPVFLLALRQKSKHNPAFHQFFIPCKANFVGIGH